MYYQLIIIETEFRGSVILIVKESFWRYVVFSLIHSLVLDCVNTFFNLILKLSVHTRLSTDHSFHN